ncbi:protein TolR [Azospira sp. I13]|uniref:ExbD/TolR family protein n=1 Tax=Azospira sp. I13 TaxID=1765050 RepID=UPI000D4645F8|nr:ExbD/TolR family protein [Azospira sp. I13]GBG02406.1 protein TolR [Azospira sp. I13]
MRPRRLKNEINVVPYIDVMLVLLVIFMVATPMMQTGSVDLPSTGKSSAVPTNPYRVIVKADGALAVQDPKGKEKAVERRQLNELLADALAADPELPVLVVGDKAARYDAVLEVLDQIKQQNVKRVGLETVRK